MRRDKGPPRGLAVRGVSLWYGKRQALDGVSLRVLPGEIVGLFGANGSGKSSVARVCAGLVSAAGGRVMMDESDVTMDATWVRARQGLAMQPQDDRLFGNLSVERNLRVIASLAGVSKPAERCDESLQWLFRHGVRADTRTDELSGGERAFVALASVLLLPARRYLLLDEPLAGLSPANRGRVIDAIGEFAEQGIGVLVIEHNVLDVAAIAERAYFLKLGRVVHETSEPKAIDPLEMWQYY